MILEHGAPHRQRGPAAGLERGPVRGRLDVATRPYSPDAIRIGALYKRGDMWWIKYYINGVPKRESAETSKQKEAEQLLKDGKTGRDYLWPTELALAHVPPR